MGKQLGLRLGTDWSYVSGAAVMALDGYVEGVRVHVHHVQPWKETFARVTLSAFPNPPGDLRLWIRPRYLAADELIRMGDLDTGDVAFDAAFLVRADEPSRARALLTDRLKAQLSRIAASEARPRLHVTDDEVRIEMGSNLASALGVPRLLGDIRAVVDVAKAIDEALRRVPCAAPLVAYADACPRSATPCRALRAEA